MKMLITGVSGFFAGWIARAALAEGHHVVGADLFPDRWEPPNDSKGSYEKLGMDLRNLSPDLLSSLKDVQAVIHAAGLVEGSGEACFQVNTEGTAALLALLEPIPDLQFVFISSMAVSEPYPGDYGRSKKEAEARVLARRRSALIFRPAMIYGPGDRGWTERIREAVTHPKGPLLYGGGQNRIQPVYVEDAAAAVLAAACREPGMTRTYCLGAAEPISQADFYEQARERLGAPARSRSLPLWPLWLAGKLLGERFAAVHAFHRQDHPVDIELARQELGFAPRPPAEGLRLTFSP